MGDDYMYDRWYYSLPNKKYDDEGKRGIINMLCFGPLETLTYGITKNFKFYYEYKFLEGYEEGDIIFYYISKQKMLDKLYSTIELCKQNNNDELLNILQAETEEINNMSDL